MSGQVAGRTRQFLSAADGDIAGAAARRWRPTGRLENGSRKANGRAADWSQVMLRAVAERQGAGGVPLAL